MTAHSPRHYWRHSDPSWLDRLGDWNTRNEGYDAEEEVLPWWWKELTCLIEVLEGRAIGLKTILGPARANYTLKLIWRRILRANATTAFRLPRPGPQIPDQELLRNYNASGGNHERRGYSRSRVRKKAEKTAHVVQGQSSETVWARLTRKGFQRKRGKRWSGCHSRWIDSSLEKGTSAFPTMLNWRRWSWRSRVVTSPTGLSFAASLRRVQAQRSACPVRGLAPSELARLDWCTSRRMTNDSLVRSTSSSSLPVSIYWAGQSREPVRFVLLTPKDRITHSTLHTSIIKYRVINAFETCSPDIRYGCARWMSRWIGSTRRLRSGLTLPADDVCTTTVLRTR